MTAGAGPPVAIVGSTATGKTELALRLAEVIGPVEVVSMDSMQVYRGMDIGTAKATADEQAQVPHHMIDLVDPSDTYDLSSFQAESLRAIADIEARGVTALAVGGTGLYVQAVIDELRIPGQYPEARAEIEADHDTEGLHARLAELDPTAASRMEPSNRRRIIRALEVTIGSGQPFSSYGPGVNAYPPNRFRQVGLQVERDELDRRIVARYQRQLDAGLLDEIRGLRSAPGAMSHTAAQALGYKEFLAHLDGRESLDDALELAINRTRRFGRRQQRWFRRDPRITWFDATNPESLIANVVAHLHA